MNAELLKFCEEVTALLNYQSDIPMQHKIDLSEAFEKLKKTFPKVDVDDQNVRDQKL